ncbi:MAG: RrF2 family transcriptional regulator [Ruminococcaceae bacterium]|nr:RrF2 family transcriptional regulator [Oscillospiraceae bacterium]
MKISTRGRYALRVMIDLAEHNHQTFLPLKEIALRQEISQKYLEGIMADLTKAGLLEGLHGKGGGYRLSRSPEAYTVGEILRLTEGDLAPVTCLEKNSAPCAISNRCKTLPMWKDFSKLVNSFFDGITLADLAKNGSEGSDYVI